LRPDFTQWHGFYEVAKHFYDKFIPEAERLLPGVGTSVLAMPEHAWKQGMTPEQIKAMLEFYDKRRRREGEMIRALLPAAIHTRTEGRHVSGCRHRPAAVVHRNGGLR